MRIVIEEPCEHGKFGACQRWGLEDPIPTEDGEGHTRRRWDCPGGSRRILPEGSLVISKENGEWPIPYVQLGLTAPVWSDDAVGIITHYLDALADRVGPREP